MKTIKELKELGLSQSMIATEMGVTRQNVNLWFTGEGNPTAKSINRLAEAITKLTGRIFAPADVYTLISTIVERRRREKELDDVLEG